jgi:hypothetical protein
MNENTNKSSDQLSWGGVITVLVLAVVILTLATAPTILRLTGLDKDFSDMMEIRSQISAVETNCQRSTGVCFLPVTSLHKTIQEKNGHWFMSFLKGNAQSVIYKYERQAIDDFASNIEKISNDTYGIDNLMDRIDEMEFIYSSFKWGESSQHYKEAKNSALISVRSYYLHWTNEYINPGRYSPHDAAGLLENVRKAEEMMGLSPYHPSKEFSQMAVKVYAAILKEKVEK